MYTKPTMIKSEELISQEEKERVSKEYSREFHVRAAEKLMLLYGYVLALDDDDALDKNTLKFDEDGSLLVALKHRE